MMKTVYTNKKTNEVYNLVSTTVATGDVVLELNGETINVKLSTLKSWYKKEEVEVAEPVKEEQPTETTEQVKKSKVSSVIEMIEHVLNNAKATYSFEDKVLVINGKKVLWALKDGIAVRENDAKLLHATYEMKSYNHVFKAKIEVSDTGVMETMLLGLVNKPYEVVMYNPVLAGVTTQGDDISVIGEQVVSAFDGSEIEEYIYTVGNVQYTTAKENITIK